MLASHRARRRHRSRGERHRARCGQGPPGAPLGQRQDRHRGLRPRPGRASASSSSRPEARPRSSPPRASRSARSTTSPASPRSWTGASRRSIRSSTPGCSPCASTRSTSPPWPSTTSSRSTSSCVNLYPFERTAARRGVSDAEVIENIDIGGPTMIRASAKNHAFAAVVVKPEAYDAVLEELRAGDGLLSMDTREALAADAFAYTARYDTAIARWFAERSEDFPPLFVRAYEKVTDLSYGENPHQRAAYYQQVGSRMHLLSMVRQHHGQAALVQQPPRPRRGTQGRARVRGPRLRDRQARQPLRRRRSARTVDRGLRARLRLRSGERLRRHHRGEPAGSTARRPRRSPSSSSRC